LGGRLLPCPTCNLGAWESGDRPQARFHEAIARFIGLRGPEDVVDLQRALEDDAGADANDKADRVDPLLEIKLNISRRIAAGPPLTDDEVSLLRSLLE
jgi:hypothetical protein